MKRALIVLGVASLMVRPALASSGTEGAAFLDIPVGAGPAALGSAYTALAADAYATVYNPAGLGRLDHTEVAAQHLSYLESIHYEFLGAVHPLKQGQALGFSAQYLGSGDIAGTDPSGNSIGDYSSHYGAYSLAYGQKLNDQLSLGITGKWINAKLADVSANAFAADLGSLYKVNDKLDLGLTVNNLGNKLKFTDEGDTLPQAIHLGGAYTYNSHWRGVLEGVYSMSGLLSARTGLEWTPVDMLSIRTGYKTETIKELSALAGLTVGFGVRFWGQELAYAWLPYGDLGDTHYISLLMRFGETARAQKNLIQYQHVEGKSKDGKFAANDDPETMQLLQLLNETKDPVASKSSGTPPR